MSQKLRLIILVFVFAILSNAQQKYIAYFSGGQEVPPVNTAARGFCKGGLNQQETLIVFSCEYSGLSSPAINFNIHDGSLAGQTAPVIYHVGIGGTTSNNFLFSFLVTPEQALDFKANRFYFNVPSENFPDGELRGQIHLPNSAYNDFDGDARTDLTVYRNSNNTFYALQSTTNTLREQPIGQPGDSVSLTVDFDGDGKSDFSTARYNAEVLWRIFKSSTNTLEETRWGSSSSGDFLAAADYDGFGAYSIAVFRAGTWYILPFFESGEFYEYFGQAGDVPAPNDYDKDGKADLAVARSENGQRVWHILRSSDGVYYSVQWGLSSDAFFTGRADWDGDGAPDISVIRNESGQRVFYILRSSDNQLQIIRWGLSSDVVKLGDYDGDGRTDAAVTRAAGGQRVFYILQSSNGAARYETFGLAGDF
jgi:hypothetical protein